MKKICFILLSIFMAAAAAFLIWSISGYLLSERETSPLKLPDALTIVSPEKTAVGTIIRLNAGFKLPRSRKITQITPLPGKGTVSAGEPVIRKIKSAWKYNHYQLEYALCGIRTGETQPGTLTIEISPRKSSESAEKFTLKIPALKIKELPLQGAPTPELAGRAPLPRKTSPYWHLLWGMLILPVILFLIFRKRHQTPPPLSLRQRTLNALDRLQKDVFDRRLSAREGIAVVSDLLRNYLEERFRLPLSRKTTPEFLSELEFNAAIPANAVAFLKNFLNAADMIKFAQAPCDNSAVGNAVASAVDLVKNTSTFEEEKK